MIQEHEIQLRVRYAETDAMGFVHHANYLSWFEMGRTELYRAQGGSYKAIEEGGLFFVVAKVECNYRKPARYDDLLTLRTKVARISPAKLEHDYELYRDGELLAKARTVLALVDAQGRIHRISEVIPEAR